jgi:LysR family transcriptional regulator, hydrogen peroxide-inducible genes activator
MEMHQVRYFLAVAAELNFTRAAEKCHVAQPSLTRAIKLLEEELGGPLFHRERANTHLSELGRMVKPHLEHVFHETQATKQLAREFTKLEHLRLKFGVMCTIAPSRLVDLIVAIRTKHASIEFEIVDADARGLEARLIGGELEVAIYANPANTHDERLHYIPLFREQFVFALPNGHRLAAQNGVRPADLVGIQYINRIHCEFNGVAGPVWRECGLDFKIACHSERDDWVLAMVANGLGFTFLPESCVRQRDDIIARPVIDPEFWRDVDLVTVRGRPHSPAVGALVREAMRVPWSGNSAMDRRGNGATA